MIPTAHQAFALDLVLAARRHGLKHVEARVLRVLEDPDFLDTTFIGWKHDMVEVKLSTTERLTLPLPVNETNELVPGESGKFVAAGRDLAGTLADEAGVERNVAAGRELARRIVDHMAAMGGAGAATIPLEDVEVRFEVRKKE